MANLLANRVLGDWLARSRAVGMGRLSSGVPTDTTDFFKSGVWNYVHLVLKGFIAYLSPEHLTSFPTAVLLLVR
jgi:hypothetical protein